MVFVMLTFASCIKKIDLDLPNYSSKLVVNGELDSKQDITVQVSRSLPIMQASDSTGYLIQNATVKVFENNVLIGNAVYFSGKYVLNKQPKNGATYRIEVSATNYNTATANLKIPNDVPITSSYIDSIGLDADGFKVGQLTVNFTDDASIGNYYKFLINYYESGSGTWYPFKFNSTDILFVNNEKLKDGSYLFSDGTFAGKTKTLVFKVPDGLIGGSPKFEISLKSFNSDYYNYLQQTDTYNQSGNGFSNDPIILRTNVTNGLGMVGGVCNAKDTIF